MVTFYAFVRDALLAHERRRRRAAAAAARASTQAIRKKPGRTEYQRGIVTRGADGRLQVASPAARARASCAA